jgi:hypothetical protein
MSRELPQPDRPWWERMDREDLIHDAGQQLRAALKTPEDVEQVIQRLTTSAAQAEEDYEDLRQWAKREGVESAVVQAHRIQLSQREAFKATIEHLRHFQEKLREREARAARHDPA